jgi:hypothetical protein
MKFEKILICLFAIGIIAKFLDVPGGPLLMAVAACGLALLYLIGGYFLFCDRQSGKRKKGLSIFAGIALSIAPLAILFSLHYWQGAGILILESIVSLAVVLLMVMITMRKNDAKLAGYYRSVLIRTLAWVGVCMVLFLTPARTRLNIQYRHDPEFAEIVAEYLENPDNDSLMKRYQAARPGREQ